VLVLYQKLHSFSFFYSHHYHWASPQHVLELPSDYAPPQHTHVLQFAKQHPKLLQFTPQLLVYLWFAPQHPELDQLARQRPKLHPELDQLALQHPELHLELNQLALPELDQLALQHPEMHLDLGQVSFFYIHQVLSFYLANNFQQQGADLGATKLGPDWNVFS
jgi:hypothetical protein